MAKSASNKKVRKKSAAKGKKSPAKRKASGGATRTKALVGDAAPEFALASTGGRTVALSELKGRAVVLYFYPRDATPGCTVEGHDFSRLVSKFAQLSAEVFGVSRDSMKSHEKFKSCENYKIDLLSDEDEKVCKLFGVMKMKNMYGKQVRGIERSTFVIDREGRVVKEWRGVKVPGHAEEVLEFIKTIS